MTAVRHFCDVCGARITADRTALKVVCGPLRLRGPAHVIDLCPEHADRFSSMLAIPGTIGPEAPRPSASATVTAGKAATPAARPRVRVNGRLRQAPPA